MFFLIAFVLLFIVEIILKKNQNYLLLSVSIESKLSLIFSLRIAYQKRYQQGFSNRLRLRFILNVCHQIPIFLKADFSTL